MSLGVEVKGVGGPSIGKVASGNPDRAEHDNAGVQIRNADTREKFKPGIAIRPTNGEVFPLSWLHDDAKKKDSGCDTERDICPAETWQMTAHMADDGKWMHDRKWVPTSSVGTCCSSPDSAGLRFRLEVKETSAAKDRLVQTFSRSNSESISRRSEDPFAELRMTVPDPANDEYWRASEDFEHSSENQTMKIGTAISSSVCTSSLVLTSCAFVQPTTYR
eukprot:COSAG02_NODE_1337_length_13193_cov_9.142050_2_plen_219_part_00